MTKDAHAHTREAHTAHTHTHTQSYDASEFEALASKYEGLSWRMTSKPGGATVKSDEFYQLYGSDTCVCMEGISMHIVPL